MAVEMDLSMQTGKGEDAGLVVANAVVERIETDALWVRTDTGSACGHCSTSGCGVSSLSEFIGTRRNRLRLAPVPGLQVGDEVVIGIADSALTQAALLAYLWPLLAMLLGAGGAGTAGLSDGATALLSLAALLAGLALSHVLTTRARGAGHFQPRLLRRVTGLPVKIYLSEEITS